MELQKPDIVSLVPFWMLAGELSCEELTRQLELVKKAGMGGMAPLFTRRVSGCGYLSAEFFNRWRHCCIEAKRLGLQLWLYDERDCPSGTAAGMVFDKSDFFRQKALHFGYCRAGELIGRNDTVAVFAANDLLQPVSPSSLPSNAEVLAFTRKLMPLNYCDTLIPETAKKFIALTHDRYASELGEFFGNVIRAVYTDDLNSLEIYQPDSALPWCDIMEREFLSRRGYPLKAGLASLVEDVGDFAKIRFDFRQTTLEMFLEFFVKPLASWSERHHLPLTGHLSGDEGPLALSIGRYGAAMPFYACEPVPGIDEFLLARSDCRYLHEPVNHLGKSILFCCKAVSSVARQFGSGACSSEILTSLGWDSSAAQRLAVSRCQIGLGINVLVPHYFGYTAAAGIKRCHPQSCFFQEPDFARASEFWAVLERSLKLLRRGEYRPGRLLITPVYEAWKSLNGAEIAPGFFSCRHPVKRHTCAAIEEEFNRLILRLAQSRCEFELADELLLSGENIRVEKGLLLIGERTAYEEVIIPNGIELCDSTLALLRRFQAQGGRVMQAAAATGFNVSPEIGCSGDEVLQRTIETAAGAEYFLVNYGDTRVSVTHPEELLLYDPDNDAVVQNTGVFDLQPLACCHLLRSAPVERKVSIRRSRFAVETLTNPLPVALQSIEFSRENLLLLDCGICEGREIFFAMQSPGVDHGSSTAAFADGLPKLPGNISATAAYPENPVEMFGEMGTQTYISPEIEISFDVPEPDKITALYFEPGNIHGLQVNGRNLQAGMGHPALLELKRHPLNNVLQKGSNVIRFCSRGRRIEPFYLAGNFSVELPACGRFANPVLKPAVKPALGNLSGQHPFYWGRIDYTFTLPAESGVLHLGEVDGVAELWAGTDCAGICFQAPYRFFVESMPASRQVTVRLYNRAQNLFGPHRVVLRRGNRRWFEGHSYIAAMPDARKQDWDWSIAQFGISGPVQFFSRWKTPSLM